MVIAPQDPAADQRMSDLNVERIPIEINRAGLNPWADFRLFLKYRALLRRLRPAAYLSFTIKPNIYGSMAASSLGIPAIPNVSGIGNAFLRRDPVQQIVTSLSRFAFRATPAVFFQNSDDRNLFVERQIVRPDQARILPGSGIDLARFAPAPSGSGPLTFLLIARLVRDKGVMEFVEAARRLRSELPDARFQLLGGPDEGHRTEIPLADVKRWAADGVIEYLGPTDDVRPFIADVSAVVLPSYREGLPRSLLEASAMARPVIASEVPGCREVVEDGTNGYLCGVRDPESLAGAMRKFANLPRAQQLAMGKAGRQLVEERFGETLIIEAYLDALASVDRTPSGS